MGDLGALDFAGGTVVHISAGAGALASALVIGRRIGFPEQPMGPANVPMVILGAALLWFGWFGFNAGSSLAADDFVEAAPYPGTDDFDKYVYAPPDELHKSSGGGPSR